MAGAFHLGDTEITSEFSCIKGQAADKPVRILSHVLSCSHLFSSLCHAPTPSSRVKTAGTYVQPFRHYGWGVWHSIKHAGSSVGMFDKQAEMGVSHSNSMAVHDAKKRVSASQPRIRPASNSSVIFNAPGQFWRYNLVRPFHIWQWGLKQWDDRMAAWQCWAWVPWYPSWHNLKVY